MQQILQHIVQEVRPLAVPFHEAFERALPVARRFVTDHGIEDGESLVADITRTMVRETLRGMDLGPWTVTYPVAKGGLHLHHREHAHVLRTYKTMPNGDPPPPGGSRLRRKHYACGQTLFDLASEPYAISLLAVWRTTSADEVLIDVVRPTGSWKYGAEVKHDIRFPLSPDIENLEFVGDAEDDEDFGLIIDGDDEAQRQVEG